MAGPTPEREDRFHEKNDPGADQRGAFQRDRDRVLYSSAFQRLAGITQIARAGEESIFHTRQQHTLKVAQIGKRLAEMLIAQQPTTTKRKNLMAVLDPEVVEAACLIHDLGHPPFGHVGEFELNRLVSRSDSDGFEGNAQSFRIVTKLAVRKEKLPGLDLSRATLAATLKYPWFRGAEGTKAYKKWSAYRSEEPEFNFAVQGLKPDERTLEAELMDWADDIAFSVHDLEDFHRCSAVPWLDIFSSKGKQLLLSHVEKDSAAADSELCFDAVQTAIQSTFGETLTQRYEGTRDQRWVLRTMTSKLIQLYIQSTGLESYKGRYRLAIDPHARGQVNILKQITRDHVIATPALAAQQIGYKKIIHSLFNTFGNKSGGSLPPFTPKRLHYLWDLRGGSKARFAADCVASLSEAEAVGMYARLNGYNSGSVLDPIVR